MTGCCSLGAMHGQSPIPIASIGTTGCEQKIYNIDRRVQSRAGCESLAPGAASGLVVRGGVRAGGVHARATRSAFGVWRVPRRESKIEAKTNRQKKSAYPMGYALRK